MSPSVPALSPGHRPLGAVVLAFLGLGVALYLAAWLLLPAPDGRIRLEQALRDGDVASVVLLVVTILTVIPDAAFRMHMAWVPLLVVGIVGFAIYRSSSARAPLRTGPHGHVPRRLPARPHRCGRYAAGRAGTEHPARGGYAAQRRLPACAGDGRAPPTAGRARREAVVIP